MPPNQGPRKWPQGLWVGEKVCCNAPKRCMDSQLEPKSKQDTCKCDCWNGWQSRLRPVSGLLSRCWKNALRKFHLPKQTFCKVQRARYWGAGPIITRDQPSPHPELIVSCLESRVLISCFNIQGPIRLRRISTKLSRFRKALAALVGALVSSYWSHG